MRIPFSKPWRAFEAFDGLSDEECRAHLDWAKVRHPGLTYGLPRVTGLMTLLLWPGVAIMIASTKSLSPLVPSSTEVAAFCLLVGAAVFPALGYLVARDTGLYLALRRELRSVICPHCEQSLLGLPIQRIGEEPDPGKQFVRCPECGKKHSLLELGVTPRELVPFEQRTVPENFGKVRWHREEA